MKATAAPIGADLLETGEAANLLGKLRERIQTIIIGKDDVVERVVTCLVAKGHVMISDVPGVGKTTLAQSLARSIEGVFQRIQFTNDMLPSDVLGVSIYDPSTREFKFRPGPLFGNIVLADEINRTTPKTQSALLEAMSEGHVTVDDTTHPLPMPFMVLATLNPIEFAGTFMLPESQMDRFLLRVAVGYPDEASERRILSEIDPARRVGNLNPALTLLQLRGIQSAADKVLVESPIVDYILALTRRTRDHPQIHLGVSPRGALALRAAVRALALVRGRDHVLPDDVKELVGPTFAHRLVLASSASHRSQDFALAQAILDEILSEVPVPI